MEGADMNTCSKCRWYHVGRCCIAQHYEPDRCISVPKSPDETCSEWTVTYHEDTDNMICPYCGYEDEDSYVSVMGRDKDSRYTCEDCGKEFLATTKTVTTYTTRRLEV